MTDKATLIALADKLEKATEGGSALDQEIFLAINEGQGWKRNKWGTGIFREYKDEDTLVVEHATVPMWTTGIDAATSLCPDGMSYELHVDGSPSGPRAVSSVWSNMNGEYVAEARLPALALSAAALRARAA